MKTKHGSLCPIRETGTPLPSPVIWRTAIFSLVILLVAAFCSETVRAQGVLTNGWTHQGFVAPGGETDLWTFPGNIGDGSAIRVGKPGDQG